MFEPPAKVRCQREKQESLCFEWMFYSLWMKQNLFWFFLLLPNWEKVFHNIPTTSRTCWRRQTELGGQTLPIGGCWEVSYRLLFRVKKRKTTLTLFLHFNQWERPCWQSSVLSNISFRQLTKSMKKEKGEKWCQISCWLILIRINV